MIFKAVSLFLVFMAVLAMFGKVKWPGKKPLVTKICDACGRHKIGKGPCPCRKEHSS